MSKPENEKKPLESSRPDFANEKATNFSGSQRELNHDSIAIANDRKSSDDSNTTGPRAKTTGKKDER